MEEHGALAESLPKPKSGIKKNKAKLAVLVLYVIFIILSPLYFLSPLGTIANDRAVTMMRSFVPGNVDQFFRHYIDLLHQDRVDEAASLLPKNILDATSTSALQTMALHFASTTDQMEMVGIYIHKDMVSDNPGTTYDVTYEITNNDLVDKYLLAHFVAQDIGNGPQILSVTANTEEQSIKEQGKPDLASQGAYLLAAILLQLFVAYTALRYIIKSQRPRWWLFLVILLISAYISIAHGGGGVQFGFNSVLSKSGAPWAPWQVMIPIPVGAIYYYITRKRYEKSPTEPL